MYFENYIIFHQTLITALSTIVQALMAVILVCITITYAKSTKTIANISKREFELNNRPFIFISDFFVDDSPSALRLFLGNSGKLPAEIKLQTASIGFYTMSSPDSNTKSEPLTLMEKRKYYVFPQQRNSTIGYPLDEDLISKIKTTDGFFLYIELEYWQIGKPSNKKQTKTIINFRTAKDDYKGSIHDIQTMSAG